MGASQSVASATDQQLKEIGPFMLRSTQKGALKILSQIVDKLLTKNNIFDLAELLSSPERCNKLFIVISSTVKKEFQLLKFPDPRNPSSMATMSFISRGSYPPAGAESVAARSRACNEITHFLIRLVTLAAACTASISRNEQIASLLDVTSVDPASSGVEKYVRDIPSTITFTTSGVDEASVAFLAPKLSQVDKDRRPNLYRFGNSYTFIIDIKKGIVYNAGSSDNRTPVFKIGMTLLKDQRDLGSVQTSMGPGAGQPFYRQAIGPGPEITGLFPGAVAQPAPYLPPQPAPFAAPVPVPAVQAPLIQRPSGNASSVISDGTGQISYAPSATKTSVPPNGRLPFMGGKARKTRGRKHRRAVTRRRRVMQRGGETKTYVDCTIEEIPFAEFRDCESICKKFRFIIDQEGNTYDYEAYHAFTTSQIPVIPLSAIKSFDDRVRSAFDQIVSHKITTVEYKERTELSKDRYKPISGATEETLKTLQDYGTTMSILPTGAAPAPYRAFTLASRAAGNELTTFFCEDTWATQFTTATMAYSLLQALYDDGLPGSSPSPRSLDACKAMARAFIGAQVATPGSQTGSEVENFHNIKFAPIPSTLDTYCKTRAPQTTRLPDDTRILVSAQREIRKLYDKQISDIVSLIKKVLYVTTDPSDPKSMFINLNEQFGTAPEGGLVLLESIIGEARKMIGEHYLAVERLYISALQKMGASRQGTVNSAPSPTLNTAL